jgi:DNA-binding NtrC family response regulator
VSEGLGKNILVIDDEEIVRLSCVRILAGRGYNVDAAAFCADGLLMLEENPYDLVLTDFKMPNMDGIELAAHIAEKHPGVKVVLFTGYSTEETIELAKKRGIHAFMEKPFTPDALASTVERVLGE